MARRNVCVHLCLTFLTGLFFAHSSRAQEKPPYKNPALPVEQRVADLLSRMSLDEKVAQLGGTWQNRNFIKDENRLFVGANREFLASQAKLLLQNGLGGMTRPSENRGAREMADFANSMQKWLTENTRLGIPVLFHDECLHGHAAPGGTSYPQAIALAATWDPALVHDVFEATAQEVRARGARTTRCPVDFFDRSAGGT